MILQYSSKSLKLEDGQELKYTHCIIAVGSLGPIPGRSTQVINIIKLFAHIHLYVYICKNVSYSWSWSNVWTKLVDIFEGTHGYPGGTKKSKSFFKIQFLISRAMGNAGEGVIK